MRKFHLADVEKKACCRKTPAKTAKTSLKFTEFQTPLPLFQCFQFVKIWRNIHKDCIRVEEPKKKLLSYVQVFHKTCAKICTKKRDARAELLFCWSKTIRRLHIVQNFAQPLFLISPGHYSGPKRIWRQCLCKILGDKQVVVWEMCK